MLSLSAMRPSVKQSGYNEPQARSPALPQEFQTIENKQVTQDNDAQGVLNGFKATNPTRAVFSSSNPLAAGPPTQIQKSKSFVKILLTNPSQIHKLKVN